MDSLKNISKHRYIISLISYFHLFHFNYTNFYYYQIILKYDRNFHYYYHFYLKAENNIKPRKVIILYFKTKVHCHKRHFTLKYMKFLASLMFCFSLRHRFAYIILHFGYVNAGSYD